jgi:hypothetical protein
MTSWPPEDSQRRSAPTSLSLYAEAKDVEHLVDACGMEPTEALALITAAANLTVAINKFIALAEQLHPLAALRARATANQSGGPVGPT